MEQSHLPWATCHALVSSSSPVWSAQQNIYFPPLTLLLLAPPPPQIESLYVFNNLITGEIPEEFCQLRQATSPHALIVATCHNDAASVSKNCSCCRTVLGLLQCFDELPESLQREVQNLDDTENNST